VHVEFDQLIQYLQMIILRRPVIRGEVAGQGNGWHGDPLYEELKALADGSREFEDVVGAMYALGYDPAEVNQAVTRLIEAGVMAEGPEFWPLPPAETERYSSQIKALAHLSMDPSLAVSSSWLRLGEPLQVALKQATIVVTGLGRTGEAVLRSLALAGVGRLVGIPVEEDQAGAAQLARRLRDASDASQFLFAGDAGELSALDAHAQAGIHVYCPEAFNAKVCARLNGIALDTRIPFLPVRTLTFGVEIGPFVTPGTSACFVCLEKRLLAASANGSTGEPDFGRLNFALGADWVAMEAVKFLAGAVPASKNALLCLNYLDGTQVRRPVLKLPRCPACGVHRSQPPRKLWEDVYGVA
jgi:bacteriocin biosynthesis cyclodehydratase domain-containing protein